MSTATKNRTGVESPRSKMSSPVPRKVTKPPVPEKSLVPKNEVTPASDENEAPSDWISLTIILVVFVLATLLMAWLASIGTSEPVEPIYFFPMM